VISPVVSEVTLDGGDQHVILWQQTEEGAGIGEPAIVVRKWSNGFIDISQEDRTISLNVETIPKLCKYLQAYARKPIVANG
jgi:hypothetical protein